MFVFLLCSILSFQRNNVYAGGEFGSGGTESPTKPPAVPTSGSRYGKGDGKKFYWHAAYRIIMVETEANESRKVTENNYDSNTGEWSKTTKIIKPKKFTFVEALELYKDTDLKSGLPKGTDPTPINTETRNGLTLLAEKSNKIKFNEKVSNSIVGLKMINKTTPFNVFKIAMENSRALDGGCYLFENYGTELNNKLKAIKMPDGSKSVFIVLSTMDKSYIKKAFNSKIDYSNDLNMQKFNDFIRGGKTRININGKKAPTKYLSYFDWKAKLSGKPRRIKNNSSIESSKAWQDFNADAIKKLNGDNKNFAKVVLLSKSIAPNPTLNRSFWIDSNDLIKEKGGEPRDPRENDNNTIEQIYVNGSDSTFGPGTMTKDYSYYRDYKEMYRSPRSKASVSYKTARDEFSMNHNIVFSIYNVKEHTEWYYIPGPLGYSGSWYSYTYYTGGFKRNLMCTETYLKVPEDPDIMHFKPVDLGTEQELSDALCDATRINKDLIPLDISLSNLNTGNNKGSEFVETLANNQKREFDIRFNNNQFGLPKEYIEVSKNAPTESELDDGEDYYYNITGYFPLQYKSQTPPRFSLTFDGFEYKEGEVLPNKDYGFRGGKYLFRAVKPGKYYNGYRDGSEDRPFWYAIYKAMRATKIGYEYKVTAHSDMTSNKSLIIYEKENNDYLYKNEKFVKQDLIFMPFNVKTTGGYSK